MRKAIRASDGKGWRIGWFCLAPIGDFNPAIIGGLGPAAWVLALAEAVARGGGLIRAFDGLIRAFGRKGRGNEGET